MVQLLMMNAIMHFEPAWLWVLLIPLTDPLDILVMHSQLQSAVQERLLAMSDKHYADIPSLPVHIRLELLKHTRRNMTCVLCKAWLRMLRSIALRLESTKYVDPCLHPCVKLCFRMQRAYLAISFVVYMCLKDLDGWTQWKLNSCRRTTLLHFSCRKRVTNATPPMKATIAII